MEWASKAGGEIEKWPLKYLGLPLCSNPNSIEKDQEKTRLVEKRVLI